MATPYSICDPLTRAASTPVTDDTPLPVTVVSGGSGGMQYTEGDTDASITGTAALWEDAADTLRAASMAKPLPIQPGTNVTFVLGAGAALVGKVGIDQTTPGTTNRVQAGGTKARVSASKTRPADTTAYAAKDAIAESTSVATVWTFTGMARATGGSGYIVKASILTDQTTCVEAFRLHLYNAAPTALQDNAACTAPLYADAASYVGTIDFPACKTEGTGATSAYSNATPNTSSCNLPMSFVTNADANLYGLLESPNGFSPANGQKFTVILGTEED